MENNSLNSQESELAGLRVEVCKDLVCQELDGEMVILNMHSGLYYGIDEVGSRIWQMLEEKIPPAAMIDRLLNEYEIEVGECSRQVMDFLTELEKNNLILRSVI